MAPTNFKEAVLQIGPSNDLTKVFGGMWEETFVPTHFINCTYSLTTLKYGIDGDVNTTINPIEMIIKAQGPKEILCLRGFFEYIIEEQLEIKKPFDGVSCLLVVPPYFSKAVRLAMMKALLLEHFDEKEEYPSLIGGGIYLADSAVMSSYGVGVTNALVVDFKSTNTAAGMVSVVVDSEVPQPVSCSSLCFEDKDSLDGCLQFLIKNCEPEKRSSILANVIINPPTEQAAVLSMLGGLICSSDFPNELQPRTIIGRQVPSHFTVDEEEAKKATMFSSWFGAGITAKCTLSDHKHLLKKGDIS